MMKVEELLCISPSKDRMVLGRVKTLYVQLHNVLDHLHIWRSKIPVFEAHVTEDVKYGFSAFCQSLAPSLVDLAAAL